MRLIDADALIEWLSIVPLENGMINPDVVVDFIRTMPGCGGWISVKDRLPDKDVFVLTYGDGIMEVMKLSDATVAGVTLEMWKTNDDYFIWTEDVTHWMPLPEPPKDGDP